MKRCANALELIKKNYKLLKRRRLLAPMTRRRTDRSVRLKIQASSAKLQAPSIKLSNQPVQSPSGKHPNQSNKRQASSLKLQALLSENHGTWILEKF